jgi:ACT domain-containing protein
MNLNKNLEWELCEAYFSILEMSMTTEISLDKLCAEAKTSREEVEKIVPNNPKNYRIFFLKILISKLDREVLAELKEDIADDTISSTYDKILEGLSLRFEKYFQYKQSLKILSKNSKQKIEVFLNVFSENYNFSYNLLTLIEEDQNCIIKTLKSLALNIVFTKSLEIFFKDETKDIDKVIRHLDKYLSDMEDVGLFMGVIKK